MKFAIVLCCVLVGILADEKYTDKYDNTNLKEILDNKRLLLAYVDCVMGRGKCTPEGKELKENLEDAIKTGCTKCSDAQERGATEVIEHLIQKEREIWNELTEHFDHDGEWRKKYEDRAREKGIVIPE